MAAVVVVYVHGAVSASDKEEWYRVELPITTISNNNKLQQSSSSNNHRSKKRRRHHHHHHHHHHDHHHRVYPVGKIYGECGGGWAVIGEDIYWVCGFYETRFEGSRGPGKELLKHNIYSSDPKYWKVASSSVSIRRYFPFVVSVSVEEKEKLCVVSGSSYPSDTYDSNRWKQCGEIYDISKKTWGFVDVDYKDISSHCTFSQIAQDVERPTEIVFYSLKYGSMQALDIAANNLGPIVYPPKFDLWTHPSPPEDLGLISNPDIRASEFAMLKCVTNHVGAVLADGTFYWCTYVYLHLYAYDTKQGKWLSSPSLRHHFPKIYYERDYPRYPILLGLGNGKFVLVLPIDFGHSVMAVITVDKRGNSLDVSVDPYHHVYYHESHFMPKDGQAMLKSTGSGSMR